MDLSGWIDRNAAFAPGKVALVGAGRELTYADLAREIGRTAAALAACGVNPGDRVAYLGYNSAEQISLLFACARLGALFAPLSWRLAPPEHRAMLADCRPRVLVVADPFIGPTTGILDPADAVVRVAIGAAHEGWIDYEKFLARGASLAPGAGEPLNAAVRYRLYRCRKRAPVPRCHDVSVSSGTIPPSWLRTKSREMSVISWRKSDSACIVTL